MNSYSSRLIIQISNWAISLLKSEIGPPNVFSGITPTGRQFLCDLSTLGLEGTDKVDFIKEVIIIESCLAFCHSMAVRKVETNEYEVLILSGQPGEYWGAAIKFVGSEPVKNYYGPDANPTHFMQAMFLNPEIPRSNSGVHAQLWISIRSKVIWRDVEVVP